jgi:7,8-dihydroneopterin aldolase/epimerase/oxygenase
MSDRILIRDLQVFARHGVLPEEERLGQRFALDITAHLDLKPAGESADYGKTVGYDALARLAIETFTAKRYALIEAAAEAVAQAALARFPAIERIEVEIRKPAAPIDAVFAFVGVRIERSRGG